MLPRRHRVSARDGLPLAALEWTGPAGRTPLLCLSGICRSALDYTELAQRHRHERRVVALDYAGHGESGRAADPRRYNPQAMLRDVLDMMAALHLGRAVVVGTSFGGLAAMAISALRPAVLGAVALNDIGPEIGAEGQDVVLDFIARDPALGSLEEAADYMRRNIPPQPALDTEGWLRLADRTYAKGEDGRFHPRWDVRLGRYAVGQEAGPVPDLWALFHGLDALPLMLLWGQESRLLSADTVQRMRRARPDMRVLSLPGTGHAPVLWEHETAAALDVFLRAIP